MADSKPSPSHLTTCQAGRGGDIEHVVACKGRPFTILTSSNLPTPVVTFIDHKLVSELKLKMSDLQCSRQNYSSQKMRVLGKISTSVQCTVSGNLHIKATVVENLYDLFETHSIAGTKLSKVLSCQADKKIINTTSLDSTTEEPTTPERPQKKKKCNFPQSSNMDRSSPSVKNAVSPPTLIRDITMSPPPPGDQTSPDSKSKLARAMATPSRLAPYVSKLGPSREQKLTPESPECPRQGPLQVSLLVQGGPQVSHPVQTSRLQTISPSANIARLQNMNTMMVLPLHPRHGPGLCVAHCSTGNPPINCGYNDRWDFPADFQMCSSVCGGAFCGCVRGYYR